MSGPESRCGRDAEAARVDWGARVPPAEAGGYQSSAASRRGYFGWRWASALSCRANRLPAASLRWREPALDDLVWPLACFRLSPFASRPPYRRMTCLMNLLFA